MNKTPYIFTEAYNCGLILNKCLESFYKFHPETQINIFGNDADFKHIEKKDTFNFISLQDDYELKRHYKEGHSGTAYIFSKVIREFSSGFDYLLHIDSDVIFRKESLSLIDNEILNGYDLIGPRRCYRHNLNGRKDLFNLPDVVQTYFFAFNKNKISNYDFNILQKMVVGGYNPLGHSFLDYFDPVSFDILNNGGQVFYLDFNYVGAQNELGSRANIFGEINKHLDFGNNLIHFAGVGSGAKFFFNGIEKAHKGYAEWALKRFATYYQLYYGIDIGLEKGPELRLLQEHEANTKQ